MKISRIVSIAVLSAATAGVAAAQDAAHASKKPSLNITTPRVQKTRPVDAPEFGGVNVQYQRVSAMQFTSDVSADNLTSSWNPDFAGYNYRRYFAGAGFNHLVAAPQLPGGARIVYIELDACDTSVSDLHLTLNTWNCDYLGACDSTPISTLTTSSGFCSNYNDNAVSQRVDNYLDQVLLDVTFGATDGTNSLAGVIVGYVLEVSPAPAVATFLDVPTSSPQFQFIEALVEAGITAGCGGGNYCPNNPVTRGQMAVFLSKLAGLSWNGF